MKNLCPLCFETDQKTVVSKNSERRTKMEYNGYPVCECQNCGNAIFADSELVIQNIDRFIFCRDCYNLEDVTGMSEWKGV